MQGSDLLGMRVRLALYPLVMLEMMGSAAAAAAAEQDKENSSQVGPNPKLPHYRAIKDRISRSIRLCR